MIEVIIIGSGTGVPYIRRAGPAVCMKTGEQTLLIDSAAGTLRQLSVAGIPYDSIDTILYTHMHPDHTGEFVPFVFATHYPGYFRVSPVTIIACEGFGEFRAGLRHAFGKWAEPKPGTVVFKEMPAGVESAMLLPPLTVRSTPAVHTPQSLSYRIETPDGKSVVFSGDTDFCTALTDLAQDADLLVSECSAPEGLKIPGHLTPSEAGRIAQDAGVKRLLLTHLYPNCDKHDLVTPCSKVYNGHIIVAEDLMRLVF